MYGIPGMIDFQSIGLDIKGVSKHWNEGYRVFIQSLKVWKFTIEYGFKTGIKESS